MSARVMPAQGGKSLKVKDFETLKAVVEAVAENRPVSLVVLEGGDEVDWLEVQYEGVRLAIQDNGFVDVTDMKHGVVTGPITPEMYPVVKAAIAEIERQNA